MKKIFLFLMLVVLITSCKSKSGRKLATQEGIIEASVDTLTPYEKELKARELAKQVLKKTVDSLKNTLPLMDQKRFTSMCKYIEAHGFKIPAKKGYNSNYQYTHIDKNGSRHAFIYQPADNPFNPYENTQIVVYAFKNGDRDPEDSNNFVGYIITANDISSAITPVEYIEDYPWIARGYYELRNLTEDSDHLQ